MIISYYHLMPWQENLINLIKGHYDVTNEEAFSLIFSMADTITRSVTDGFTIEARRPHENKFLCQEGYTQTKDISGTFSKKAIAAWRNNERVEQK